MRMVRVRGLSPPVEEPRIFSLPNLPEPQPVSTSKIIDFEAGKAAADEATASGPAASTARKPGTGTETTMRSDLVEQASEIIPEPPLLINMISRRVKQLNMGRTPLVTPEPRMGVADIALLEIIEGKVAVDEGEDDA